MLTFYAVLETFRKGNRNDTIRPGTLTILLHVICLWIVLRKSITVNRMLKNAPKLSHSYKQFPFEKPINQRENRS